MSFSTPADDFFPGFEVEVRDASHLVHDVDISKPMRHFEITEVVEGQGLWLRELDGTGAIGEPIWIDDETASYVLDPGNMFSSCLDHGETPRVPAVWENCDDCQKRIRERRRARASVQ